MQTIDEAKALNQLAFSINSQKLAVLCGAGLSMSSPSSLPSAWSIAQSAKSKFDALYCPANDPLPVDIEQQAAMFFDRGELDSVYLSDLVDQGAFAGHPNEGHFAIADFILTASLAAAVSTNVDSLIETAGLGLYGQVRPAIELKHAVSIPAEAVPLVKIHGCWTIDRPNTVWTPRQLEVSPTKERVDELTTWLSQRMLNCDLLIVGFFTDWDYLNGLIELCLSSVKPNRIFVVDPASLNDLKSKAPKLVEVSERAASQFVHVRSKGETFLAKLRQQFSVGYVRRALASGLEVYRHNDDPDADDIYIDFSSLDNSDLWQFRRNIEGILPNQPATQRQPSELPVLGYVVIKLRARGAVLEGAMLKLGDRRIRVVNGAGKFVHDLKKNYDGLDAPSVAPDFTIAIGATENFLPSNVVRPGGDDSIVRPSSGVFCTQDNFEEVLGIV